ncbi:hypothetical protein GCM10020331_040420 [Ectobacillus funiculus]
MQELPMGTAYAVWTGIGTAGSVIIGILFFSGTCRLAADHVFELYRNWCCWFKKQSARIFTHKFYILTKDKHI